MNLLDDFKALQQGDISGIKDSQLFILNRWTSGNRKNLPACAQVNRAFYFTKPRWLLQFLAYNMSYAPFVRMPKPTKCYREKFDIIAGALKKLYGWSDRVINLSKSLIIQLCDDKKLIEELSGRAGWDDKQRKLFGLGVKKFEAKKQQVQSLFSY